MEGGPAVKECVQALGGRQPARRRLAQRIWRTRLHRDRTVHLLRGGAAGERADPAGHAQHRRTDAHAATVPRSRSSSSCPAILDGTVEFAIGYSEPGAGSDLASLRTTAVARRRRVRDQRRRRCSPAAPRTPTTSGWRPAPIPKAKKHKGISIFIVPTSSPGFSWQPLHTMPGVSTFYTFYDDVRVPASSHRRGRERGMEADHHSAELRARRAGHTRCARAAVREDAAVGADHRTRRRLASSTSRGCSRRWPASRPRSRRTRSSTCG